MIFIQLLVLLSYFIEITFFVCNNRIKLCKVKFRKASNRCERVLEAAKVAYANKKKSP